MEEKEKFYQEYLDKQLDLILELEDEVEEEEEVDVDSLQVFEYREGYAKVYDGDAYNFIDEEKHLISDTWFDSAEDFSCGRAKVKEDEHYYWIDGNGERISEEYSQQLYTIDNFFEGYALVTMNAPLPDQYNYVDTQGNLIFKKWLSCDYYSAGRFQCGLARVEKPEGFYNFIDAKGNFLCENLFRYASPFSEGYATVADENGWHFIDTNGNFVTNMRDNYFAMNEIKCGLSLAHKLVFGTSKTCFVNVKGERVGDFYHDAKSFKDGLAMVAKTNTCWNYIDTEGKPISDTWFREVEEFRNGLARVRIDDQYNQYNYIDRNGNLLCQESYTSLPRYFEGEIVKAENVVDDRRCYCLLNRKGREVGERYDEIRNFKYGFALVERDGRFNYITKEGKPISDIWFDEACDFENGLAVVRKNGWYFIDGSGNPVDSEKYEEIGDLYKKAESFVNGYVRVTRNGQENLVNTNGHLLSNEWYDKVYDFDGQTAKVYLDREYNWVDKTGNPISDIWFSRVWNFNNEYAVVSKYGRYNVINRKGDLVAKWALSADKELDYQGGSFIGWNNKPFCVAEDLGNYKVIKIPKGYLCISSKGSFHVKHRPVRIYGKNFVLCVARSNREVHLYDSVFLYDREEDTEEFIGFAQNITVTDNLIIYDSSNDYKVFLMYADQKIDVSDRLEGKRVVSITPGVELIPKHIFFLENEEKLNAMIAEAKEKNRAIEQRKERAKAEKELTKFQTEEEKRAADLEKESAELDAEIAALFERKIALNEKKAGKKARTKVPDEVLYTAVDDHLEIYPTFLVGKRLKQVDLSGGLYDNVKIAGVDFRGTNIDINPQRVYEKNLSGCNFVGIHFARFTDFTGVHVEGTIFGPGKNEKMIETMPPSFASSYYDENTIYGDKKFVDLFGPCQNVDPKEQGHQNILTKPQ